MNDPLELAEAHHIIRDAGRFRDLLDSPVCGILIKMLEHQWFEEIKRASGSDALVRIQAKANALEDVLHGLRTVISAGERDALEREKRERPAQHEGVSE